MQKNSERATDLYAPARDPVFEDCYFYHTMDIPGHGTVYGEWDLRGHEADYLGHVNLAGKRVLEIGSASGHLTYYMERMGADVVAFDLSGEQEWDVVPYYQHDYSYEIAKRKAHVQRVANSWWFCHNALNSKAKIVYETIYHIPDEIGSFAVGTMGSILLHLRDPFLALQKTTQHVTQTMIITDIRIHFSETEQKLLRQENRRLIQFLPDSSTGALNDTWWLLTPEIVMEFLRILGFPLLSIQYHQQNYRDVNTGQYQDAELFTIVANRK